MFSLLTLGILQNKRFFLQSFSSASKTQSVPVPLVIFRLRNFSAANVCMADVYLHFPEFSLKWPFSHVFTQITAKRRSNVFFRPSYLVPVNKINTRLIKTCSYNFVQASPEMQTYEIKKITTNIQVSVLISPLPARFLEYLNSKILKLQLK